MTFGHPEDAPGIFLTIGVRSSARASSGRRVLVHSPGAGGSPQAVGLATKITPALLHGMRIATGKEAIGAPWVAEDSHHVGDFRVNLALAIDLPVGISDVFAGTVEDNGDRRARPVPGMRVASESRNEHLFGQACGIGHDLGHRVHRRDPIRVQDVENTTIETPPQGLVGL